MASFRNFPQPPTFPMRLFVERCVGVGFWQKGILSLPTILAAISALRIKMPSLPNESGEGRRAIGELERFCRCL